MSFKKKINEMMALRPRKSTHTEDGAEILDPKPLFIGTGLRKPPTQEQRLQNILRNHRANMAQPSYSDETDFSFDDDDIDFLTPYEKTAHIYEMSDVVMEDKRRKSNVKQKDDKNTNAAVPAPNVPSKEPSPPAKSE